MERWCLLLCVVPVQLFAQPAGRGVISGSVVEAGSGDAVRKAVVTVTWRGTPRAWATTRTDGSGGFSFEGLPAGAYDLRADKMGLGTAVYGANSVRELGDVITLGEGEVHGDIKLRFLRSSTISGTVVDAEGEPVVGVNVTMLRPARNGGERILVTYLTADTNDRGEYKITGIDRGQYYLRCVPYGVSMGPAPRVVELDRLVPQYYGGARESKDMAPVILRGGETLTGIDFHLTKERPATITGRITGVPQLDPPADPPAGQPVSNGRRILRANGQFVSVQISDADDNTNRFGTMGVGAQGPDYRFEMPGNFPGRYRIEATVRARDKSYYASQVIDAHEGVNEVVLALSSAVEVKGHLKVEGSAANSIENLSIMLEPPGAGPSRGSRSAPVKKDGSFAIEDVPPGEWFLNFNPPPEGLFEKSVRLADKDFLYKGIAIPPGSDAPLNIVVSSNVATVTGEIDEAKRAGILLVPMGARHLLARFYYSAIADDAGKFKVNGVAPGKYKIFALAKIETVGLMNPESGDALDALGEDLEVPEGAQVESHPKLIPEEKAKEILKP